MSLEYYSTDILGKAQCSIELTIGPREGYLMRAYTWHLIFSHAYFHVLVSNMASEGGSSNLLQLFWELSSVDGSERLEASRKLVLNLRELQVCNYMRSYLG